MGVAGGRKIHSEEWKKKKRESMLGTNNPMWGKCHSDETKIKIREASLQRENNNWFKFGEQNPMFGKHHSEETKIKISESLVGKHLGINSPMYGKHPSEETREKLRKARSGGKAPMFGRLGEDNPLYGRKLSEEHKRKISVARSGEKAYNWKGGVKKKKIPLYDTYAPKLSWCESVRREPENINFLQVKCTYCGKWYRPKQGDIKSRIAGISGLSPGENRLYCSRECKYLCPIYHKQKYSAEETNTKQFSREVQPELRQLVFERDNWTCIKCNNTKELQCHHLEGIRWEPIESADIDKCITLCKGCHEEVHKMEGCKKSDMRCDKNEMEIL